MRYFIAQGIGLIGMILVFAAFQKNDKRKILWAQASAGAIFALHFLLLGALTGMGMNLLEIARNVIFAREYSKRRQTFLTALFVVLFLILSVVTWISPMSLFPAFAMSLSTVAFSLRKPRYMRLCSLPVSLLWLIYNAISFSIAGIVTEAVSILSIVIAILRVDVFKKSK